jgi:hypothetical protein
MAGIPPNWLGSIIQSQGAQQRAAADKAKQEASQTEGGGNSFSEKLQDVIEASDRDSQVYSDAEGQGSQGRPSETPDESESTPEENEDEQAGTGPSHLDVEA